MDELNEHARESKYYLLLPHASSGLPFSSTETAGTAPNTRASCPSEREAPDY
jgi:hypothetical protein